MRTPCSRAVSSVRLPLLTAFSIAVGTACSTTAVAPTTPTPAPVVVVATDDVVWEKLNPARGDASPLAATLWGDRNGSGPTGFLFGPSDGFMSPPHIHNVSYRGVVIRGLVHNGPADAEQQWMPAGSFWTQPKGGAHVTGACGDDTLAYIEIDEGPYLVKPPGEAFDAGEPVVNRLASELEWHRAPGRFANGLTPKVAPLWGDPLGPTVNGSLVELPAGFSGTVRGDAPGIRAVVIAGSVLTTVTQGRDQGQAHEKRPLAPGSLLASPEGSMLELHCPRESECVLYVRAVGPIVLTDR